MAFLKAFKETSLPGTLQADSLYFIAPAGKPDYVEVYLTGTSASTVKRVLTEADVIALITSMLPSGGSMDIVNTIADRNSLTPDNGALAFVIDATGDATVTSGAATYIYRLATTEWVKIHEHESLDLSFAWANLQGKPTSAVADIDDAVTKRHSHSNKTELDKVGQDGGGVFTYGGLYPKIAWDSTSW